MDGEFSGSVALTEVTSSHRLRKQNCIRSVPAYPPNRLGHLAPTFLENPDQFKRRVLRMNFVWFFSIKRHLLLTLRPDGDVVKPAAAGTPTGNWITLLLLVALGLTAAPVQAVLADTAASAVHLAVPNRDSWTQMLARDAARSAASRIDTVETHTHATPHFARWRGRQAQSMRAAPRGHGPRVFAPPAHAISTSFPGLSLRDQFRDFGTGSVPPDTMGAIGPDHFLEVINTSVAVFERGGRRLSHVTLNSFFQLSEGGINYPRNGSFDPRVLYDRRSGRWIATALERGEPSGSANELILAISATSDPTGDWSRYLIRVGVPAGDRTYFSDFDTLGTDDNGIYIAVSIFSSVGDNFASLVAIEKGPLLAGQPAAQFRFANLEGVYSTPQPALSFDPVAPTAPAWFVASWPFTLDTTDSANLTCFTLTWRGASGSRIPSLGETKTIFTGAFAFPPDAPARDTATLLDVTDFRLQNAVVRNQRLWTCRTVGVNSFGDPIRADRSAIEWLELDLAAGSPSVRQSGRIYDNAAANPAFYLAPSIAVNGQGHAVIGFTTTSADSFAGVAFASRLATDPLNTFRDVLPIKSGERSYQRLDRLDRNRWGDYSFTSVDPRDDSSLWTIQQYAKADGDPAANIWGTWVAKILAPPPTAASPGAVARPGMQGVFLTLSGSGFYDPGSGFSNRFRVAFTGGSPSGVGNYRVVAVTPTLAQLFLDIAGDAAPGPRDLVITNPDGQSATVPRALLIEGTYPVLGINTAPLLFVENSPPLLVASEARVTLASAADATLTAEISANYAPGDRLSFYVAPDTLDGLAVSGTSLTVGGATVATVASNPEQSALTIRFTRTVTANDVQTVTRHLAFHTPSDHPSSLPRSIRILLRDATGASSGAVHKSVQVQAVNDPPFNQLPPAMDGIVRVGQKLNASPGFWSDAESQPTTFAFAWHRATRADGTDATRVATAATYTVAVADAHRFLRVTVTATDASGAAASASSPWSPVANSAPSPAGDGSQHFALPALISNARGPQAIATADLNNDGLADLAVANYADNSLSIHHGKGDGTFRPPVNLATEARPHGIAIADINRDGLPDVLTANIGAGSVSLFLARPGGEFFPRVNIPVGRGPAHVLVADLNGDSLPDLITANYSEDKVAILLGRGDGTFLPRLTVPTARGPIAVIAADFDRDGRLDLAVANQETALISLFLNRGNASFRSRSDFPAGPSPRSLVAADFNGDGLLDLAVTSGNGANVSVLMGRLPATFGAPVAYPTGSNPRTLVAADFNADGRLDLAVANSASDTISVLLGNGDATFQTRQDFPAGTNPRALVAADFNRDGQPDLVAGNFRTSQISLLPAASTAGPTLAGSFVAGREIVASPGRWSDPDDDRLTFSFEWQRASDARGSGAVSIPGASSARYTTAPTDAGSFLRAVVAATDSHGGRTAVATRWQLIGRAP